MDLKERVQSLCRSRGITAQRLEIDLGFGKGYVSKLNASTPNAANVQKMATYFGVSTDFIMTGEDTEKPAAMAGSGLDEKFLTLLKQLTPDEIQRVGDFVQGILSSR